MSSELLVNVTPMETRVALVSNGILQEIAIERTKSLGIVGNIYCGKVMRVLPGMQAAFIDIGQARSGFIHVDDVHCEPREQRNSSRNIRDLLVEGQSVVVQVIKDPIGSKGARLTTQLSVSSRYLVYMPGVDHIGVSQRIDSEEERERLRQAVAEAVQELAAERAENEPNKPVGFIVRTVAEGISLAELRSEIIYLQNLWQQVSARLKRTAPAELIYEDLALYLRFVRDMYTEEVEKVRVDSRDAYLRLQEFTRRTCPELEPLLELHEDERALFSFYGIEDEIDRALHRKVELKSGGYLIFDQTEAMTTIDVNTGAFVGHRNLEETIFKNNLEAAAVIARQLRLRNLGGIIIIDFIDMRDPEHTRQLLRLLEKALGRDRVKTTISGISPLGLVEMTRKRTSESLGHLLCEPCSTCQGRGYIKSAESVCYEILRSIQRAAHAFECNDLLILASPLVIDRLLDEESAMVAEIEALAGKSIQFRVEEHYPQEQFDIIPV